MGQGYGSSEEGFCKLTMNTVLYKIIRDSNTALHHWSSLQVSKRIFFSGILASPCLQAIQPLGFPSQFSKSITDLRKNCVRHCTCLLLVIDHDIIWRKILNTVPSKMIREMSSLRLLEN